MKLSIGSKKLIVILNDILISIISTYLALFIRYESFSLINYNHLYTFIIFSFLFLPFFFYFDLYSNIIRYTDINYYKSLLYSFIFYIFFPINFKSSLFEIYCKIGLAISSSWSENKLFILFTLSLIDSSFSLKWWLNSSII